MTFLVYFFLLGPLLIIIVVSFGPDRYLAFPPNGFSLKWYSNIFEVSMFMTTFKISITIALLGNFIALLLGLPAAYALSRYNFRFKNTLNAIFISPILIPGIVLGFTLLKFLIISYNIPMFTGLLIGHIILMIPYIVRVISSSLANLDFSIEEAAMSLGANRFKTFFIIVLPNIHSGIIAGVLLSFLESFNTVDVSLFLSGPGISTLPIQMLNYVEYNFDPTIAAMSVLLMVFTVIFMFVIERTLGLTFFTKSR
ncbi:ABC transporter permease [Evansella sp. AB-P1]|uniref:ABC transporter permease n=1 Tax=Evansella sp. AB-P1 TaxID=3037653 RepID=UPI00241E8C3B|nr:ABC transporter permease [Evansella sp. AB-P1]MDG5789282.1 ABC transporter permease [Evansella sp. AB-P1]